ncbi:hypothetical protein DICPUDRAFT_57688 [Dictyostelium purpureum]|uniref:Superoxide dismutase [Cu-Zn] n=1 Tax=Dictyostelium purpureum TaxID=5786 RepID=F0ZX49_DICPU|nr:uncharacterized protein DICPUDRAFT_57688 [Dictyostelium purpureum]EGC31481.1 hypothetical protein DICPUDRAFT_57688 [Dictyostelium purpureum]|eukprot:XP_003291986.1 hypothetical protein DICPUDRAFT_57688 [Dictyostelium purpureum]
MPTAMCLLKGPVVSGWVKFYQECESRPVAIEYEITGLSSGKHGFHIHTFGDTSNGCISAGPHYNPFGKTHGGSNDINRHVGDLGNIIATGGTCKGTFTDNVISLLNCQYSIVGRTVVVHADEDDLGKGGHEDSLTTGHAGARIACGVIGWIN